MKRTCSTNKILAFFAAVFLALTMAIPALAQQTLTNQLVGYWPMDGAVGCNNQTPDVINGYNLSVGIGGGSSAGFTLTNFNNLMFFTNDAVRGNSIFYRGSAFFQNQGGGMYLAYKSVNTNDLVPVNRYSPASNTVSFWIKAEGTPANYLTPNADERIWTESDYIRTYASVFDISPTMSGYDIFLRQTPSGSVPYGNFSGGNHTACTGTIVDGTWHNVTLETQPAGAGTNTAIYVVYIDGVVDPSTVGAANLAKPNGTWKLDTLSLFALVRNGVAGQMTNDVAIDDLAEWSRPLSTAEITNYMMFGITNVTAGVAPLTISSFASDLYSVVQGASVNLNWQVSPDATDISIDNGVGDVFSVSSCGVGTTSVTVNATTTYHIVVTRGGTSITNALTVNVINGVAAGWNYVGGFNENTLGALLNQGNWQTLLSSPQTAGYTSPQVLQTVTGNHVLGIAGPTELSAGFFGHNGITLGNTNTLFFRFYVDGNIQTNDNSVGAFPPDVNVNIGASDAILRDLVDFTGAPPYIVTSITSDGNGGGPGSYTGTYAQSPNGVTAGPGPAVRIFRNDGGNGGPIDLTANYIDGTGAYQYYSYVTSVDPNGLMTNTVYNVWIDIYNNQNGPTNGTGAASYYSVTVQPGGDTGVVTNLFPFVVSDRTTNSNETLNEAFICAATDSGQSTNEYVRFDDFYLSTSNINHTLPVPQGSFVLGTPVAPLNPTSIHITSVSKSGNSVTLNWSTVPTGSFSFTVQSRASLNSGSWSTLTTGLNANTYTDTGATGSQNFYRVTSP